MMPDLTLAEAAALLRRNKELVRQWLKAGRLQGHKRVGRWFVGSGELASFRAHEPVRRQRRTLNAF
jgi:hypothetical protein